MRDIDKENDLGRADRLWRAINLLKEDLRLNQTKTEAGKERAHWLIDQYESELFEILARYDLNPKDYGY
jgi:hypothetical protein